MKQLGLYHNDIKPANLMVKEVGETRLLQLIDFESMSVKKRKLRKTGAVLTLFSPAFKTKDGKFEHLIVNKDFDHALDIY